MYIRFLKLINPNYVPSEGNTLKSEVSRFKSEGERNFIALLYFYHQVKGLQNEKDATQNRIVIIDDSATSMNSGVMFMIASLIIELMQNCINFYRVQPQPVPKAFISQMFVFTHNYAFYRLIAGRVLHEFKCVSVYLAGKHNNELMVSAYAREIESEQSKEENYSPVKSSYATLWA